MVGVLQAPAGTRLYERLKKEGRLLGKMSGNTDGTTNIVPQMDLDTLRAGYQRIVSHIYSPKHYYRRVKVFLREYQMPNIQIRLELRRFIAFFRSCLRLGVIGRERVQFWKLLSWTLVRRPGLLPLAVTLAIYGHHFRKVCKAQNR